MPPDTTPTARRRPTIRDIAAAAGVSKGLVSMILSGRPGPGQATTERVLAIAEEMGYRPDRTAKLLSRRRTRLLGVTLIPSNTYHGELVEEIQRTAEAADYEIVLGSFTRRDDERGAIETLIGFRCEALLLLGPAMEAAELARLIGDLPSVSVGRVLDVPGIDVVRADDATGIAELVDHLVGLGHRTIAHVDGGVGVISQGRCAAYEAAMARHGLQPVVAAGGHTEEHGRRAAAELDLDEVTAVVAFNDRTAIGVLDHLDGLGVPVPGAVSVTGFDDSLTARLCRVDLTTVNQAPLDQARLAVRSAIERLDGARSTRQETVLPARLVLRGSTGPVRSPSAPNR